MGTRWAWDGVTGDVTRSLAAAAGFGRGLAGQIARFGELAGRDLSARAVAAPRAGGAYQPLTAGEKLEMLALRAAVTGNPRLAAPAGAADARSSWQGLQRPVRLRRPSPPAPRQAAGRHHRAR
jgi:hypothetical protein